MGLSLLIPTYSRPDSIRRFVEHAVNSASGKNQIEILFGCHADDTLSLNAIRQCQPNSKQVEIRAAIIDRHPDGKPHLVSYWNQTYQQAKYDIVGFFGDDVLIKTPGWDEIVTDEFRRSPHLLVYGNDVHIQKGRVATLFFTHKATHQLFGYYLYPALRRWYMDEFMDLVYRRADCIIYKPDLILEHIHPDAFKEAKDAVYISMNSLVQDDYGIWNSAECITEINRCIRVLGDAKNQTGIGTTKRGLTTEDPEERRGSNLKPPIYQSSPTKNILYVRTDAIGDAVLSAGMLPYLKNIYPESKITVVCREHIAELYKNCPYTDGVITFVEDKARHDEGHRKMVCEKIKSIKPDLILNPVRSPCFFTHVFSLCVPTAKKVALRGDFSNIHEHEQVQFEKMYDQVIETGSRCNEITHHQNFLNGLYPCKCTIRPLVWPEKNDFAFADEFLAKENLDPSKLIAIFAGAQFEIRSSKILGQSLNRLCRENGYQVVALGIDRDFNINQQNCIDSGARYINMCGKVSLMQCAAILKHCRLALGVETSLAHIACAMDTPTVIVSGGGHLGRFAPFSPTCSVVTLPLECFQCNWYCRYSLPVCLVDISPSTVEVAIRDLLSDTKPEPRVYIQTKAPLRTGVPYPRILSASEIKTFVDAKIIAVD